MKPSNAPTVALAVILAVAATFAPDSAAAQLRNARPALTFSGAVTLSVEARSQISAYYSSHSSAPQALPPGIRKNLQRGKPIPPGLARKSVPGALRSDLAVPSGYDVVEVGLDVLLVEVATGVIHDVLMDVVR